MFFCFLVFSLVFLTLQLLDFKINNKINIYKKQKYQIIFKKNLYTEILFILYFFIIIFISFYSANETIITLDRYSFTANLVPFSHTCALLSDNFIIGLLTILCNILLFIPLGIFIPYLTNKIKSSAHIIAITLFVSILIESNQIILSNTGNIDNIIFSIIGALIGFYSFKFTNPNFFPLYKDNISAFFRISSITCSFFLIFQICMHISDYNLIKNKMLPSSSIPTMLDEFNMEIVASIEDEFSKVYMSKNKNGDLYIRRFIKKLDNFLDSGNIKISSEQNYYVDNKQNLVYFEILNSNNQKITTLRLFLKSNESSTLILSYKDQSISQKIQDGYSIVDVDVSNLNLDAIYDHSLKFKFD